jgi:hypothetical protein
MYLNEKLKFKCILAHNDIFRRSYSYLRREIVSNLNSNEEKKKKNIVAVTNNCDKENYKTLVCIRIRQKSNLWSQLLKTATIQSEIAINENNKKFFHCSYKFVTCKRNL